MNISCILYQTKLKNASATILKGSSMHKEFDILNPYNPADDMMKTAGTKVRCNQHQPAGYQGKRKDQNWKFRS